MLTQVNYPTAETVEAIALVENIELTKSESRFLACLFFYLLLKPIKPTLKELSSYTDYSKANVQKLLNRLRLKKIIDWERKQARTINILKEVKIDFQTL